jgi:hypothetical protein
MIFKLRYSGFDREFYKDSFMADNLESLAGNCFILGEDINNFYSGNDFKIINSDGEDFEIKASRDLYIAFDYYYNVWDDFDQFKILPHGKGTLHESPWVLDLIKHFKRVDKQIEIHGLNSRR